MKLYTELKPLTNVKGKSIKLLKVNTWENFGHNDDNLDTVS